MMAGEGTYSLEEMLTEKINITRASIDKCSRFCYDKWAWGCVMVYTCEKCLYTFSAAEGCCQCPDCGKMTVRTATEKEELEYYRNRQEFATEIKRYVLVAVPYSDRPAWYIDEEDTATVGSKVEVDYGVHQDIQGVVVQVLRCDKHYPPYSGRIKPIWEIIELKEEKPRC